MNRLKLQEVEEYLNKQYAKNKKWPSCPISRTWIHCKIPTNPKKLLQKQKEWKNKVEKEERRRVKELNRIKARKERQKGYKKYHDPIGFISSTTKTDMDYEHTKAFYETIEWKQTRDKFLSDRKTVMMCSECGATPDPNYRKVKPDKNRSQAEKDMLEHEFQANRLVVDHKLPIKYFWHLRLEPSNFQILCGLCNKDKLNTYSQKDVIKLNRSISKDKPLQLLEIIKK